MLNIWPIYLYTFTVKLGQMTENIAYIEYLRNLYICILIGGLLLFCQCEIFTPLNSEKISISF